jgi:hypothetical protein
MAKYSNGVSKGAANVQGIAVLTTAAATPRRGKIYDWSFGCNATPADAVFEHIAQRCTTAATGAALTEQPLDPADTAASTLVLQDTITADPTLTAGAIMLRKPLNQRATFRWVAPPGGELVLPATASNGYMLGLAAASTTTMSGDVSYEEQ